MEYAHFMTVLAICGAEAEGMLKQRRVRHFSVHPYNRQRRHSFPRFLKKIKRRREKFLKYYRMSLSSFNELIEILRPFITKQETSSCPISVEERLAVTLRYLSTGNTFTALQHEFQMGRSTIADIVIETCQAIWFALKDVEMPQPSTEEWLQIADHFQEKTDFPNCVGAVDAKHIRCIKPRNSSSKFCNYQKHYSIVLMAVADSNLRFVSIDVGAFGEGGESTMFRNSTFGEKLYGGKLNIPPPRTLHNTDCNPQPFVFIGDEAFKIHTNLLRPFSHRDTDARKRIYNDRLSRARRSVESAFGLLAKKWRIFHTPILVRPDAIADIVKACCVLHNFVRKRGGEICDDSDEINPFSDVSDTGSAPRQEGPQVRDYFADYFMGPGAVPCLKQCAY